MLITTGKKLLATSRNLRSIALPKVSCGRVGSRKALDSLRIIYSLGCNQIITDLVKGLATPIQHMEKNLVIMQLE